MGSELIEKKASEIDNFPFDLKMVCKHIVLSHHGKLEYGSPRRPKFLEALIVSYIDELDSRINALEGFMRSEKAGNAKWTKYHRELDRYLYLPLLPDEESSNLLDV